MKDKTNKERTILVRVDEETYQSIRTWCKDNGINLSMN